MKILLTGATGFIGSRLLFALRSRGHDVIGVARRAPAAGGERWIAVDFATARTADWLPHLAGVDAVVNAVGIFRETPGQTFEQLHVEGPRALFEACVASGVPRAVQLSALGADEGAETAYHRSKKAADDALLALPLQAAVAQPSLVFGGHGESARVFLGWASLPLLPLPLHGEQPLQPIHLDDAVQALVALVEDMPVACLGRRVALVGPRPLTLVAYLQALRRALGLARARTIALPRWSMDMAARIGDRWRGSLFDSASWRMLQRGNVAPPADIASLLGRPPRDVLRFIEPVDAPLLLARARLGWLLPVLRVSVALVWIVTGVVSLGLYPPALSFELLARSGVPEALRPAALYGAAALDLALGVMSLLPRFRRAWLWGAQAVLIVVYTVIITVKLPEFWLHPYGPVLKNLPMLAALLLLAMLEPAEPRR
ncbi:MAG: SDR family oxidoreductase [Rhizobacter sp.]